MIYKTLFIVAFVTSAQGAPADGVGGPRFVIEAGQEALLERTLTLEGALHATGWRLVGAAIEAGHVDVRYSATSPAREVVLQLLHPSAAQEGDVVTTTFAIRAISGADDASGLSSSLAEVMERVASSWRWRDRSATIGGGAKSEAFAAASAPLGQAHLAMRTGDHETAEGFLAEALSRRSCLTRIKDRVWLQVEVGLALIGLGLHDGGDDLLREALQEAAPALTTPGDEGQRALSLQRLRANALLDPDFPIAKELSALREAAGDAPLCDELIVGADLTEMGRSAEVLTLYRALVKAAPPACPRAWRMVGSVAFDARDYRGLERFFEAGAERFPEHVGVVSHVANYLKFVDRRDEAIALFEGFVRAGNLDNDVIGELFGLYARRGVSDEMLQGFITRADADARNKSDAFFAGALLHYKGEFERSSGYLRRALPELDGVPRVHLYLGMNAHRTGDPSAAQRHVLRAVEVGPNDPDVYYCRGIVFMDDDPAAALADLGRYLEMTHGSFDVPPAKQKVVEDIYQKLKGCQTAPKASTCVGIVPP